MIRAKHLLASTASSSSSPAVLALVTVFIAACSAAEGNPGDGTGVLTGTGGFAPALGSGGAPVTTPVVGSGGMATNTPPPPATGAGGAAPGKPIGTGSFCDALGVVRSACQGCHGTDRRFGAPMTLATYADFIAPAVTDKTKRVVDLMPKRLHDPLKPMPPSTNPPLTPDQLATLDAWLAAGAQPGTDPTCGSLPPPTTPPPTTMPPSGETFPWPADCEAKYQLTAAQNGTKHTVPAGKEEHPQIYIKPPWPGAAQALAFRPITDNAKVLHHWIIYSADGAFITGWAPGSDQGRTPLPADVGMYLPATGNLRLDMHYNNLGGTAPEQDASGVEVCVIQTASKFRANTATIFGGFAALPNIPANQKVDNVGNCTISAKGPVHLLSNSPHMHLLGVNAKLVLTRGGQQTVLHDGPFSFDDQRSYPFSPMVDLMSNDKITTTCTYQNTTSKTVTFGENTGNEMCFNFVLYYPMGNLACAGGGLGIPPSL